MKIVYDPLQKKWKKTGVSSKEERWGADRIPLFPGPYSPNGVTVQMKRRRDGKIGPLAAIVTGKRNGQPILQKTWETIAEKMTQRHGLVYIFTPQSAEDRGVKGWWFDVNDKTWKQATFPAPDVLYNRIPTRAEEKKEVVRKLFASFRQKGTFIFNPSFFSKFQLFRWLRADPYLRAYLPDTRLLAQKDNIQQMLARYGAVYVKPEYGSKGDGVILLENGVSGGIMEYGHCTKKEYPSISEWLAARKQNQPESNDVIQQKIALSRHRGRLYDFRLIFHKVQNRWIMTGLGARAAGQQSVTTHVPKGGALLALEEIDPPADQRMLCTLGKRAAKQLEKKVPELCEVSFDIGRDTTGHYWIFEANAKPMEFDELDIENRRIDHLVTIFHEKSGF